ncbi:MAG: hypothetical protein WCS37_15870 [Chloroflexota bacterium]
MTDKALVDEIRTEKTGAQKDRVWVWGWTLFTLVLASLPFIWGYLVAPPGTHFMGLAFNALDSNSYLAKMELGARGEWRFSLVYTSEEHSGEYVYLFYILLGKVQGLIGLPNIVVYHLARFLFGLLLLLTGYRFICRYFGERRQRRTAFLLLCFSAGLGWLVAPFGLTDSTDLWVAESLTFFTLLANPHYPAATALLLLAIIWTQDGWEGKGWSAYGKAAGCGFILGFVHPFMIVPLSGILGSFVLRRTFLQRAEPHPTGQRAEPHPTGQRAEPHPTIQFEWSIWLGTLLVGIMAVLGPLYTYIVMNGNPFMRAWLGQNQTLSPFPVAYLTGYGLLLVAALPGLWWVERRLPSAGESYATASRWQLLTTWLVVNALLLYLPVGLQRRFVEGLHLPIVCLATAGLYFAWKLRPRWSGRYVLATTLSTFLILATQVGNLYARPDPNTPHPLYLYSEEVEAMVWLRSNTSWRDTVIASPVLGNYIPTRSGNRVYYGHDLETVNRADKAPLLGRFLRGEMVDIERQAFIQKNGLRYLYYGPEEQGLGDGKFDPTTQGWSLVYSNSKVKIFRLSQAQ